MTAASIRKACGRTGNEKRAEQPGKQNENQLDGSPLSWFFKAAFSGTGGFHKKMRKIFYILFRPFSLYFVYNNRKVLWDGKRGGNGGKESTEKTEENTLDPIAGGVDPVVCGGIDGDLRRTSKRGGGFSGEGSGSSAGL